MTADPLPILATHGGKFHCDEVFAYAVLRLALGLRCPGVDHTLLRTRDAEAIKAASIVWDVGFLFDPETNRFDHHQRGAPLRDDGTPYSSAGLVWRQYGEGAVLALLRGSTALGHAGAIAAMVDAGIVRRIDELDNGVGEGSAGRDALGLATLIADFNPSWDDAAANGAGAGDAAFLDAAELALGVLVRRVEQFRARLVAEAQVLAAHQTGDDPRLLVLETGMPWKGAVFSHGLPVLFTISPASNGNWMVDAVPPEPGSFAQRLPLPEAWAGLDAAALVAVSGVPDAVFVHLRRFVAAAGSREGALALARKALAG